MKLNLIKYSIPIIGCLCFIGQVSAQVRQSVTAGVTFEIKHSWGAPANGSFDGFFGSIVFDPHDLSKASISASINAQSVNTGLKIRDDILRDSEYFDTDRFPRIAMTSTKIEKNTNKNEYFGYFSLTIKNITKNIKIPFTFEQMNTKGIFRSTFVINRLDFKIGRKSILLDNTASILITIITQQ